MSQMSVNTKIPSNTISNIDNQSSTQAANINSTQNANSARVEGFSSAQRKGAQTIPKTEANNLRGQVQEGSLDKVKRWFKEGSIRAKGNAGLSKEIVINHSKLGPVTYKAQELKSFINTLPRLERAAVRENIEEILTKRIDNGIKAYQNAISGDSSTPPPSVEDAADLMLFLDAKAHATGNAFQEGAFSIEDNGGKIYEYLDRCPEKYLRSSSHMKGSQKGEIQGHTNVHRGIDVPPGPKGLPNNKATILFASIKAQGNAAQRIYLKPEPAGCRISTLSKKENIAGGGLTKGGVLLQRSARFSDVGKAISHAFGFLGSITGNSSKVLGADGVRKERIPPNVKDAYNKLVDTFEKLPVENASAKKLFMDALKAHNPTGSDAGLHTMINNIKEARALMKSDPDGMAEYDYRFAEVIVAFSLTVSENIKNANHLEARIGNEVMFDAKELLSTDPLHSGRAQDDLANSFDIMQATNVTDKDKVLFLHGETRRTMEMLLDHYNIDAKMKTELLAIINKNPGGGDIVPEQLVDNLKDFIGIVNARLPQGVTCNEINRIAVSCLSQIIPFTSGGNENISEEHVLREQMLSAAGAEKWSDNEMKIAMNAPTELLGVLKNISTDVKEALKEIPKLPIPDKASDKSTYDTDVLNLFIATTKFQAKIETLIRGAHDNTYDVTMLTKLVYQFATADMGKEEMQELHARFASPGVERLSDYMAYSFTIMQDGGMGEKVDYNTLVGNLKQQPYIITGMQEAIAAQQNKEPSDKSFEQKMSSHVEASLQNQTQEVFANAVSRKGETEGETYSIQILDSPLSSNKTDSPPVLVPAIDIDGKRSVPFDVAAENVDSILPEMFTKDFNRDFKITVKGESGEERVIATQGNTTEEINISRKEKGKEIFELFSFTAEDGKKYLDFDKFRAVASLICQTTLAPTENMLTTPMVVDGGERMGSGGQLSDSKRNFVYDPKNDTIAIEYVDSRNVFTDNMGGVIELKEGSHTACTMDVKLNKNPNGSYDVKLSNYSATTEWELEDEAAYLKKH